MSTFDSGHTDQEAAAIMTRAGQSAEEVAEVAVGLDFIKRLVGAWDCCGTCAGGVLAAHDAALTAKAKAEAWDEGYEAGSDDEVNAYWGKGPVSPNPYREPR